MAEFSLPRNSVPRKDGRVFKAPAGAGRVRVFKIYRYDPDSNENPRIDTYEVDMDSCGPMVSGRPHQDKERDRYDALTSAAPAGRESAGRAP